MRALCISLVLLFVHYGSAAFEEVICHNDYLQRYRFQTQLAFVNLGPVLRGTIFSTLTDHGALPQLLRLFATPDPLEHPITAAECLDAVSLIPDSLPRLDTHKPGEPARLNLLYTDAQRQKMLKYRLDTGFVSGNCLVEVVRRPPLNVGLLAADASAMALAVFPNVREKARAVIEHCLSGNAGQPVSRFGYVGTRSMLSGAEFDYVVAVTVWSGEQWRARAGRRPFRYTGEQFFDRDGEMELELSSVTFNNGWIARFPFDHAFNQ
ncbi:hypothetical protein MMC13_004520 [Lambiella insularis]|nr:hypothetical protein [Lambiella insularis]